MVPDLGLPNTDDLQAKSTLTMILLKNAPRLNVDDDIDDEIVAESLGLTPEKFRDMIARKFDSFTEYEVLAALREMGLSVTYQISRTTDGHGKSHVIDSTE